MCICSRSRLCACLCFACACGGDRVTEEKRLLLQQIVGETGASCIHYCYRVVLRKHNTDMEIPSTVVGWKSTSRHTVQNSGVKKMKLKRCGQK